MMITIIFSSVMNSANGRVINHLEDLEKSGNFKVVREKSGKMTKVREMSGKTVINFI